MKAANSPNTLTNINLLEKKFSTDVVRFCAGIIKKLVIFVIKPDSL